MEWKPPSPNDNVIGHLLSVEAARCRARVLHALRTGDSAQAKRSAEHLEQIEQQRKKLARLRGVQ